MEANEDLRDPEAVKSLEAFLTVLLMNWEDFLLKQVTPSDVARFISGQFTEVQEQRDIEWEQPENDSDIPKWGMFNRTIVTALPLESRKMYLIGEERLDERDGG